MKSLIVAGLLLLASVVVAETRTVVRNTDEGGYSIDLVSSQPVVNIGPDKKGKRTVSVSVDGKVYRGVVSVVEEKK